MLEKEKKRDNMKRTSTKGQKRKRKNKAREKMKESNDVV